MDNQSTIDFIYDDESDNESKIPYEIPQEVRKITTQAYDKSVYDIVFGIA